MLEMKNQSELWGAGGCGPSRARGRMGRRGSQPSLRRRGWLGKADTTT